MVAVDSLIGRVPPLLRYGLAALLLCGIILAMLMQRAAILRNGQEVQLEVVPVDPRDLFRGDYVILNYQISTVNVAAEVTTAFTRGQQVFVTLRPDANGMSRAVAISAERPAVTGADIVISGLVIYPSTRAVSVKYGLESYFVPQGEGRKIERTARGRLEVVAAVAPSGQAAIKRLLIDGVPVYDEPPY